MTLTAVVKHANEISTLKNKLPIFPKVFKLKPESNSGLVIDFSNSVLCSAPTAIIPAYIITQPLAATNPDFAIIDFLSSKDIPPSKLREIITTPPINIPPRAS